MIELLDIINHSYDGIWVTDNTAKILYVNKMIENLYKITPDKIIGKNVQELLNNGINPGKTEPMIFEAFRTRAPFTQVVDTYTGRQVLVTATPIFDQMGKPWRAIVNKRDLTTLSEPALEESITNIFSKENIVSLPISQNKQNFLYNKGCHENEAVINILSGLSKVSHTDVTILFEGETGVGKEYFAKYAHEISSRASKPFVSVNCSAIPENLIESELFGYEKGAFTGAIKQKIGYFEQAQNGTILLDEVGELPISMQAKLLRVLQEKKIQRIGSEKALELNVRVIAATNKNLKEMTVQGVFREDLYYRLSIIPFVIPPLRERKLSIPHLIDFFLKKIEEKYKCSATINPKVLECLCQYNWPGNIRELENELIKMVVMSPKKTITLEQVTQHIIALNKEENSKDWNLEVQLENFERDIIKKALVSFPSIRKTATALGVSHPTLLRKIKKYKLTRV